MNASKEKTGVNVKIIITPTKENPMTLQDVMDFIAKMEQASQSEPESEPKASRPKQGSTGT